MTDTSMHKVNKISASQHKGHSMLCIGDGRTRGCITKLHDGIFIQSLVVCGFVKPGACNGIVHSMADSDVILPDKKKDIIIF
jgi:hypothetical protein